MPGYTLYSNELSIEEKIALAEYLWEKHGKDLAADSEIDRLLGHPLNVLGKKTVCFSVPRAVSSLHGTTFVSIIYAHGLLTF
jgi:hypothetical protein